MELQGSRFPTWLVSSALRVRVAARCWFVLKFHQDYANVPGREVALVYLGNKLASTIDLGTVRMPFLDPESTSNRFLGSQLPASILPPLGFPCISFSQQLVQAEKGEAFWGPGLGLGCTLWSCTPWEDWAGGEVSCSRSLHVSIRSGGVQAGGWVQQWNFACRSSANKMALCRFMCFCC